MQSAKTLHAFITFLTDLCFPPTKETALIRTLTPHTVRNHFRLHTFDSITTLSSFESSDVRALIHEAKYHGNHEALMLLAEFLGELFLREPALSHSLWIPIPLSKARMRQRGYNQTEEILKALSQTHPLRIESRVLTRIIDTKPQARLSRDERLGNVHGAFSVVSPEQILRKNVVVFDDVTTTGATLSEAGKVLRLAGAASVRLVALAH